MFGGGPGSAGTGLERIGGLHEEKKKKRGRFTRTGRPPHLDAVGGVIFRPGRNRGTRGRYRKTGAVGTGAMGGSAARSGGGEKTKGLMASP